MKRYFLPILILLIIVIGIKYWTFDSNHSFSEISLTISDHSLFDLGVTDINADDILDIFTVNHSSPQSVLIRNKDGLYEDAFARLNLEQDPNFPGLARLDHNPDMRKPGLYIHWRLNNLVVRNNQSNLIKGEMSLYSPLSIQKKELSKLIVNTKEGNTGLAHTSIKFEIEKNGSFEVAAPLSEQPIVFFINPPTSHNDIYIGKGYTSPINNKFDINIRDRHGMAFADYNGDEHTDVFILRGGLKGEIGNLPIKINDRLYVGNGKSFEFSDNPDFYKRNCSGRQVAWVDFDNDGLLDIYAACGKDEMLQPNQLYKQVAPNKFTDVANKIGLDINTEGSFIWLDIDNDADMDLLWAEKNSFYLYSNTNGNFEKNIIGPNPSKSHSPKLSVVDIDQDNDIDIFAASLRGNSIILNKQGALTIASPSNYGLPKNSATANWVDYDNDSLIDLHAVPGGLYKQISGMQFIKSKELPDLDKKTSDLWRITDARCSWFDADNDGTRDLLISSRHKLKPGRKYKLLSNIWRLINPKLKDDIFKSTLYMNKNGTNNWLQIKLIGPPGNRPAIGAKVKLTTSTGNQTSQIGSAEGSHYSQGHYRLYFGLGKTREIQKLEIIWPNGQSQLFNSPTSNQLVTIENTDPTNTLQ